MPEPSPFPPQPPRKSGRGRKSSTKSSPLKDPNPLRVAHMVADSVEMAPRLAIPLEVRIGARLNYPEFPNGSALLDLHNTEDGREYQIIVLLKPKPDQLDQ